MKSKARRSNTGIVPALGWARLTGIYDLVVSLTVRERVFKSALLQQVAIESGCRVLDVGCGTGTLLIMASSIQREARRTERHVTVDVGANGPCRILPVRGNSRGLSGGHASTHAIARAREEVAGRKPQIPVTLPVEGRLIRRVLETCRP